MIVPFILLLLAACGRSQLNNTELLDQLEELKQEEQDCMSLSELRDVVHAAALPAPASWGDKTKGLVLLTSCNLKCLHKLFPPWMQAIENAKGGDFSEHVVIVGNGLDAYVYCDFLRSKHKHRCVLDRFCLPPRAGVGLVDHHKASNASNSVSWTSDVTYGTGIYWFSLVQKVTWASEVVNLDYSVLWSDMDIHYFANPFEYLFEHFPEDGDVAVQTEYWGAGWLFKGEMCHLRNDVYEKYGVGSKEETDILCSDRNCSDVMCADKFQPSFKLGKHNYVDCCALITNGGQWLINPSPGGKMAIRQWLAMLFIDSVVQERLWNGSSTLDQGFLWKAVMQKKSDSTPLYKWDKAKKQYVNYEMLHRSNVSTNTYVISMFRWQSKCHGPCGSMGWVIGYDSYFKQPGNQLVCVQPKKMADRVVSMHLNCGGDTESKAQMLTSWLNWTFDEELYWNRSKTLRGAIFPDRMIPPIVFPDW